MIVIKEQGAHSEKLRREVILHFINGLFESRVGGLHVCFHIVTHLREGNQSQTHFLVDSSTAESETVSKPAANQLSLDQGSHREFSTVTGNFVPKQLPQLYPQIVGPILNTQNLRQRKNIER
jgi:hypothetical protein